jgi:hypothetical protein
MADNNSVRDFGNHQDAEQPNTHQPNQPRRTKPMTRQEALDAVSKHGSQRAAARAMGWPFTTLNDTLRRGTEKPSVTREPTKGRSLAEFRNAYDKSTIIPGKVKAALKALGSGWEYEVDFAKMAGVSLGDLGKFRDQFAEYVVQIGRDSRRAWAGTKATADAMRDML